MWGPKKIFAKIMNGKLIIRVGGGFMLIDEFLRNYYETELKGSNQVVINVMEENGTMSQRPLDAVRSATPTKSKIFNKFIFNRSWKPRQSVKISQRKQIMMIVVNFISTLLKVTSKPSLRRLLSESIKHRWLTWVSGYIAIARW